jgi:hypothetical protein
LLIQRFWREHNVDFLGLYELFAPPVRRYIDFKAVESSYVYKHSNKIWKVPATPKEALTSSLMGMFQKNRFKNFLKAVHAWDPTKPVTPLPPPLFPTLFIFLSAPFNRTRLYCK